MDKIQFMANDSYLVSTGSTDSTILVWKTDFGNFEGLEEDMPSELDYEQIDLVDLACI